MKRPTKKKLRRFSHAGHGLGYNKAVKEYEKFLPGLGELTKMFDDAIYNNCLMSCDFCSNDNCPVSYKKRRKLVAAIHNRITGK